MRNKPTQAGQLPESAPARMPGGAAGVPQADNEKALEMGARKIAKFEPRPDVPVKRYRVLNGGMVVYRNCRTALRAGKEVSELEYDLTILKRQGIRLELIKDETPEAPVE